jgi:hypothetical protein
MSVNSSVSVSLDSMSGLSTLSAVTPALFMGSVVGLSELIVAAATLIITAPSLGVAKLTFSVNEMSIIGAVTFASSVDVLMAPGAVFGANIHRLPH